MKRGLERHSSGRPPWGEGDGDGGPAVPLRTAEQEPTRRAPVAPSAPPALPRASSRLHAREIAHVLAAPDARVAGERDAWGARHQRRVVSESRRRAVVSVTGLGAPSRGRAHQLWLVRPASAPRSLGLLDGETPLIAPGLSAPGRSLKVTTEPVGGSKRPTSAPLVQLALESVVFGE
ncbi:anti-sigma factor [Streptomyces sp. NPDC055239]